MQERVQQRRTDSSASEQVVEAIKTRAPHAYNALHINFNPKSDANNMSGARGLDALSRNEETLQKNKINDDRMSYIMTPAQNSASGEFENTPSEQNSSHYHRFKRHSTGYQS
jgi:hypothetical protein